MVALGIYRKCKGKSFEDTRTLTEKPRIWYSRSTKTWLCCLISFSCDCVGGGITPSEAYYNWKDKLNNYES